MSRGVAGAADGGDHLAPGDPLTLDREVLRVVGVASTPPPSRRGAHNVTPPRPLIAGAGPDDHARLDGDQRHALVGHEVVALVRPVAAVAAGVPAVGEGDLVGHRDGEHVVGGRLHDAGLGGRLRAGADGEARHGDHRHQDGRERMRRAFTGRLARSATRSWPSPTRRSPPLRAVDLTSTGRPLVVERRDSAPSGACCRDRDQSTGGPSASHTAQMFDELVTSP